MDNWKKLWIEKYKKQRPHYVICGDGDTMNRYLLKIFFQNKFQYVTAAPLNCNNEHLKMRN